MGQETRRDPARHLQRVTAEIGTAIHTRSEVASAVLTTGIDALGAAAGAIGIVDRQRDTLNLVASHGYPRTSTRVFREMALDFPAPLTESAREGKAILIDDPAELDRRYPDLLERRGSSAEFAVATFPLRTNGDTFGSIGFSLRAPRRFTAEEREFMAALASLSAQVLARIEGHRLYDRTARLHAITAELAKALRPEDVGRVVVDDVLDVLGAVAGRIVVRDRTTGEPETLAASGYPEGLIGRATLPADRALADDAPVLVESLAEVDEPWAEELRTGPAQVNACAAFPLHLGTRQLGAIGLAWRDEREFTSEEVDFLRTVADACAQALDRTALYAESERARSELHQLLDRLGEAVVAVDESMRVTYANKEARSLLERKLAVGRRLPTRWNGLDLQALARGIPEDRVTTTDGRVLAVVATPLREGAILILRDETRRELQEKAEHEFVANAAHELRTPLAGIATAADALERGAKDNPAERDYFIGGIVSEVRRLVRLSDALLLLARVQARPSSLLKNRVPLRPLVTEVAAQLEVKPGVRIRIDVGDDDAILGDRNLLEGALSNIARNANQHTTHGEIAFHSRRENGSIVLDVSDTGSGMDEEVRVRATERFFRGGGGGDRGFGLGLPMAKEIVRVLGGTLEIERQRRGTLVRLHLSAA